MTPEAPDNPSDSVIPSFLRMSGIYPKTIPLGGHEFIQGILSLHLRLRTGGWHTAAVRPAGVLTALGSSPKKQEFFAKSRICSLRRRSAAELTCSGTGDAAVVFPQSPAGRWHRRAKMAAVTEGSWRSLPVPLSPGVLRALRELRFHQMTPVQVRSRGTGGRAQEGGRGRCQELWGRCWCPGRSTHRVLEQREKPHLWLSHWLCSGDGHSELCWLGGVSPLSDLLPIHLLMWCFSLCSLRPSRSSWVTKMWQQKRWVLFPGPARCFPALSQELREGWHCFHSHRSQAAGKPWHLWFPYWRFFSGGKKN